MKVIATVVKTFFDKLFKNEHEWNKFKGVYNLINEKYANIEYLIYILSNVFLSNAQKMTTANTSKLLNTNPATPPSGPPPAQPGTAAPTTLHQLA